ncbi:branched-chain amino acid ABC transporter permease [Phaeobacter gallaeciensis]|jgi:branched-chain amino acid transport system permease protein/urea transport system permease protein|uniref:branched-chain amino acid ABC transporter permease n=1 Tax=Phaeobacter gallaeciensis TaxID=60890 RepID=UPI00237FB20E|nr:branched-chain amino acid ABC transporter permease [Phaeobacter gallaeciensis]MDE4096054.1 branched-chain amino acid ABC transporter permease [Phaeobacter gallaeciensis]MDE4104865.1 branched-chain amino acid ABC transporter permease [Phaeobacter gallaeciensis]MDE4109321.1 branched-chain amino acid ABC transporter permease [Phaeobacter gallaeciensis]MDE4113789.1 branched-chain amino acid ABC transporter permease [Phaeobacter gallaeciensis]MDE4118257.1 branched-chain amino acid ABC transporte
MSSVLVLNLAWQISTLALVALGLAIVFGKLQIMNMAHGEFVMIGAYAPVITSSLGLPAWLQVPVCLLTVALVAFVLERTIIRHLYGRMFDSLLATWGIAILLREAVELIFGRGYQSVTPPISGTISVLGADYPAYRIAVILGILAGFAALFWWNARSKVATRIKAMVGNPDLAEAVGINTARLSAGAFIFGCCTAGLAGLILAPTIRIEPMMGLDYLIRSFFALVVGGLGSLEGLGIGAGIVAGTQSVLGAVANQTYGYLAVLSLSILFLWLKPDGIRSSSR